MALLCALAIALLIIIVWIFGPNLGGPAPPASAPSSIGREYPAAPDIEGIAAWLNTEPLSLDDLKGKVVLLDFWTYTCVNCVRTFPALKAWQDRYSGSGLAIIGIHTPEFEFEKDPTNVQLAAHAHGITWPIALDNDYVTWDNYENVFWPTKYLIDAEGKLRHYKVGEGRYEEVEEEIRALLVEAGNDLSASSTTGTPDHSEDQAFDSSFEKAITRELYAGYLRGDFEREYYGFGYVDQYEYYSEPGRLLNLEAPDYLARDFLYFHGAWRNEDEFARHGRATEDFEDYVALVFSARTVNVVLSNEGGEPVKVRALLEGKYLTEENKGADVTIGPDGESYLWVDQSRMYRVVENPAYVQGMELRLSVKQENLGVYAFTFGIYAEGP